LIAGIIVPFQRSLLGKLRVGDPAEKFSLTSADSEILWSHQRAGSKVVEVTLSHTNRYLEG